ncbi:MAG: hypothetical protein KAV82_02940 [Phycisphaerae bacterium]|nr:hypothetical protein [Phycisphaerae bacterium]
MMIPLPSTNIRRIDVLAEHFAESAKLESQMRENLGGLGYNVAQETQR